MWQASPGTSKLGSTGMEITRIGLGTWAIGGGGVQWGWGPQRDEESIAAIHRGLDQGLNWIDTAAAYGFGHSEEVVGRALRGLGSRPACGGSASMPSTCTRCTGPFPTRTSRKAGAP
jgi:diketogulonate reductase-like aldo/keto reductase